MRVDRVSVDELARKYLGRDYPDEWNSSERGILKVVPESQIVFARGVHDIRRQHKRRYTTRFAPTKPLWGARASGSRFEPSTYLLAAAAWGVSSGRALRGGSRMEGGLCWSTTRMT